MSGWAHASIAPWTHRTCGEHIATRQGIDVLCGCYDPIPDPASPCGFVSGVGEPCENPAWQPHEKPSHDHIATRCLICQHPVAAVPS